MKTKEELNALKEEELEQVSGGVNPTAIINTAGIMVELAPVI